MQELFSVSDKVAVVTGGSSGIGAMIAKGFLEGGARVYITARKEAQLLAARDQLAQFGDCRAIVSDLSSLDGIAALTEKLQEQEGGIDILVNNAGATWGEPIEAFSENGWDKVMDLNVKSPFFLVKSLLPMLKTKAEPSAPAKVINVASVHGLRYSHMENYSYTASKSAVLQLTQHLAARLAQEHINVNAIAPGFFPSKMTAFMQQAGESEEDNPFVQGIPMKRMGQGDDIAAAAIYLASRGSNYVTGATLTVDGGVVASA